MTIQVANGMLKLSMFIDQHASRDQRGTSTSAALVIPFRLWKEGYIVRTDSSASEEWKIKKIESITGVMQRDDCQVTLINVANEMRLVKGSTLQSSYKFVSTGDLEPPEPGQRTDVKPFAVSVAGIREFYPRSRGEGTRVIMQDKTAYVVLELFNDIWAAVGASGKRLGGGPHEQH